jgi:hypothetical protein
MAYSRKAACLPRFGPVVDPVTTGLLDREQIACQVGR